ncbi:DUF3662 and FHA domain-containing protein [Nostocoides vanveenii]|jgi:hypothetical protein|uniref:Antibiotic biosynthesis regulator FhaA n=1 Tax=Nostocoides vanveenii TaxID=330835 RepID=A0ABP4WYC1_9MICO
MGRLQRIENKLERAINGAFAKAFRAEVQPVEIASAVRRAMDDGATALAKGRTYVPTSYRVELSESDYERLHTYEADLEEELLAAAEEHAESQRYLTKSGFDVTFSRDAELETGLFRVTADDCRMPARTPSRDPERNASRPGHAGEQRSRRESRATDEPRPAAPVADAPRGRGSRGQEPAADGAGRDNPASYDDDPLDFPPTRPTPPARPATPAHRPLTAADRPWLDLEGDRYPLLGAMTVLGRDTDCAIVVEDVNASRRHSEIRVTVDGPRLVATVKDLGSTNGTWVNGERVTSQRLTNGDRLTVGRTSFVYRSGRR